jgi:7,8-dihydro-6-hydroxymethylpterin-pyrophosphokinase
VVCVALGSRAANFGTQVHCTANNIKNGANRSTFYVISDLRTYRSYAYNSEENHKFYNVLNKLCSPRDILMTFRGIELENSKNRLRTDLTRKV